jgi:hypothetical protein
MVIGQSLKYVERRLFAPVPAGHRKRCGLITLPLVNRKVVDMSETTIPDLHWEI